MLEHVPWGNVLGGPSPPGTRGHTASYAWSYNVIYYLISMSVSVLMCIVERARSLTAPVGCGQTTS